MIDVAHDLMRALRSVQDAARTDRMVDLLSASHAIDRILADLVTLHSLRLGRTRPESAPEDAVRLARMALDDARPFVSVPVSLHDDEVVVPLLTDGAAVVRILSAMTTCALERTVRGEARMEVTRDADEIVWTLRVRGLGLEQPMLERQGRDGSPQFRSSLDLALARERAAALGGRITVCSDPDGTCFVLGIASRRRG